MRRFLRRAGLVLAALSTAPASAQDDADAGKRLFRACQSCHTLATGQHMTGPSLANLFGRRAGGIDGFKRYSPALSNSGVVWDAESLDKFLANPQALVPGNWMTFPGIEDAQDRIKLIAYLRAASISAGPTRPLLPSLKPLEPRVRVSALRLCGDTYFVTTGDGVTRPFWEFKLRFKTNSSPQGPEPGAPAILRAGMMGDRATIVFAAPGEISDFVQARCE